ncbi:hypothetical protein ACQ27_gp432 [Klebsiella phage K64-1]|nr:hypothetical protein ACQ27_gp432 [Klebsiella phage K64-1]
MVSVGNQKEIAEGRLDNDLTSATSKIIM